MGVMRLDDPSFTAIEDAVAKASGKFRIRGWIKRKRELADNTFILLRDSTNELQCVAAQEAVSKQEWEKIDKALVESSVIVEGELRKDKRAPHGLELKVTGFDVVAYGGVFPIGKDLSEDYILSVRHLWLRSKKMAEVLKFRSNVTTYFREFFNKEGYVEVQAPMFVTGAVEGGSTLFEVPYFGKKAYLTQSSQFYLEAFIFGLEKVYTLAPSFRAEKSRTRRHVAEFWHLEMEAAWMQLDELIDFEERMIQYVCKRAVENDSKLLKSFGRNPEDLAYVAEHKFERKPYREVLEIAKKKFKHLKWGADLGEKEERELTKDFKVPLVITHYPKLLKPFYHRPNPDDTETVLCNDILAPEGYGEIIGSGERCWQMDEILERMKLEEVDPKPYKWYTDLREYGGVPHSGFGLGIERTVAWMAKLPHIRDAIAFPRTMGRLYP